MTPGNSHYNTVPLVCIGILDNASKVVSVTFLVTVNDTWYPDEYNTTCLQTVKTPPLRPNTPYNESQPIQVGKCDHGPLTYTIGSEYSLGKFVPCSWNHARHGPIPRPRYKVTKAVAPFPGLGMKAGGDLGKRDSAV